MTRGETVVIHRHTAGEPDPHGNATATYVDVAVDGVFVAPLTDEEFRQTRDLAILGLTVYLPAGTVVEFRDRMTVRSDEYKIIGDPARWVSPYTGVERGVAVRLQRVEG